MTVFNAYEIVGLMMTSRHAIIIVVYNQVEKEKEKISLRWELNPRRFAI